MMVDDFIDWSGKRVQVITSKKNRYRNIIGRYGVVERHNSRNSVGVKIDNIINPSGSTGLYWFNTSDLMDLSEGDNRMLGGYNWIARVQLLEDNYGHVYNFAVFETEEGLVPGEYVVVNPRKKENMVVGRVYEILHIDDFKKEYPTEKMPTAEVIDTVDVSNFEARCEKEKKDKERAKRKADIMKALKEESEKINTLAFYQQLAKDHKDNEYFCNLVKELEELENEV